MIDFNAWREAWLPVVRQGQAEYLPLREVLLDGHNIDGLGADLTPIDRDALLRFLISIAAVILRDTPEMEWIDGGFSPAAVERFDKAWVHRFNLGGPQPFLQRWDKTEADITALVSAAGGKEVKGLLPIEQLHPQFPGGSSSKWAVRLDTRDPRAPAATTQLLVTAWFQTKAGNGQDPWSAKALKGSSGTWHVNPLALYFVHPGNLGRTLHANVPEAWLHRADLPFFLDRTLPNDIASSVAEKQSVSRFTYAKTLPLLYAPDGDLVGYVLGPDSEIVVPMLGKDDKESLGLVHAHDHTRLYVEKSKKGGVVELLPRGSFRARLTSTEGFTRWFRADGGVHGAVNRWESLKRVHQIPRDERHHWHLNLLSEVTDGKGTREWASWDAMPLEVATADGELLDVIQALLRYAGNCQWRFVTAGRIATGDSKVVPAITTGQAAFYTAIEPILARFMEAATHQPPNVADYAHLIARAAIAEFTAATAPLVTPRSVPDVAQARATFRRGIYAALAADFPPPATEETR